MAPEFNEVDEGDRRFRLIIEAPSFPHNIPSDQLLAIKDEATREKWKLDNIIGQKLDYLIRVSIQTNNNLYYLETETIRGKQFRKFLWTRICLYGGVAIVCLEILFRVAESTFSNAPK